MSARPLLCAQRGAKRFLWADFFSAYESARPDLRITPICKALSESKVSKLQELDLSYNGIGPPGGEALGNMLLVRASLTALDVRYNGLGNESKALLQQAVQGRNEFRLKM